MSKSINRGVVKKFIIDYRNEGKTDQEIYNELAKSYFDKKSIVLLITGTARNEDIVKYKPYNIFLISILLVLVILKLIEFIVVGLPQLGLFTPLIPLPLINIYLAYEISKYNAGIYIACAAFTFFIFVESLQNQNTTRILIPEFILSVLSIALVFYLVSKLFPNYKPRNLEKDANGEYILK